MLKEYLKVNEPDIYDAFNQSEFFNSKSDRRPY